jgi:hypothetical protein
MTRSVELSALDLRYESYRMRNPAAEARLLASIAERGIEEALEGVDAAGASILLNGFKRYRCASKLRIRMAPYASLGEDEAAAIVTLLRVSNDRSLTILEQARFIEKLRQRNAMSVADIADRLSRSKSWVSMRLGLMAEMSAVVREKLFSGGFPVYPYMYTSKTSWWRWPASSSACAKLSNWRMDIFEGRPRFARRSVKDTWPWLWTGSGKCPRTRMAPTSSNACC